MSYPIVISPLSDEDGGGFVGIAPDLLGCVGDGATAEEALSDTQNAIAEWLATAERRGMPIPAPGSASRRLRAQKRLLADKVRELAENVDQFDERIRAVEVVVKDISERLENADAWERFNGLSVMPVIALPLRPRRLIVG